jgi:hypothetical protein
MRIISDETFALAAILSFLASVVGLWSAIRRRQLMRRLLRSLTEEQRRAIGLDTPPDPKP